MTDANNNVSADTMAARHRAAVRTAVVAGAFCLIVGGLLLANRAAARRSDPINSEEMAALQKQLFAAPDQEKKEEMLQEIRALDVALRRAYFRSMHLAQRGAYLLAGGLVALVISLCCAAACRKKLPMPGPAVEDEASAVKASARRYVASIGAALACAAVLIVTTSSGMPGHYTVVHAEPAAQDKDTEQVAPVPESQPALPTSEEIEKNWSRFRGPGGNGISAYTNAPAAWNGGAGEGIIWKSEVPLPGQNSPVVWADRVFLTGATAEKREVYCFDANSGKMLWRKEVASTAEQPGVMEEDTGYAAPTAATDGRRVYAIFATGDVACFDIAGKEVWTRALGVPDNMYGHSSSLAVCDNLLLVQFDQGSDDDGTSVLYALNSATGEAVWEAYRPVRASWASPIVIETPDARQVITCAAPWVIAYDPDDGIELWRIDCLTGDVGPSPVCVDGILIVCQDYAKVAALKTDGEGDVTETHVIWEEQDGLPDTCSPLSTGELVFLVNNSSTVTCYDVTTGKVVWTKDFDGEFYSSPSLVGDNVYLLDRQGVMHIFEAAREYKQVGRAELGEETDTCPAFLDGRIYIRGKQHLYCIGTK